MGIGAFGRLLGEEQSASSQPGAELAGNGSGLTAFIDQGTELEGTLRAKGTVRIDGEFRGEVVSENAVIVGETGALEATIRSKNVIISGAVAGNVVASRQLVLHKTARLHGNVETPSLILEQGALFNGKSKMVRPEVTARAKRPHAQAGESKAAGPSTSAAAASAQEPRKPARGGMLPSASEHEKSSAAGALRGL